MRRLVPAVTCAVLLTVPAPAIAAPSPPGSNDPNCNPTAAHSYPVVLVHGTFENQAMWAFVSPQIKAAGYCVFSLDYGNNATGDIPTSAGQLGTFIDQVLSETGASKVDIVGHSQGGMMPRYWMKFDGGGEQGRRPTRHRALEPRHHEPAGAARRHLLPGVRSAGRRVGVHHEPQLGRRHPGRTLVHRHLHALRRGGHAVRVAGAERLVVAGDEHRAPEQVPARPE